MPARRCVTLSSDLGAAYAAQMKGVLARSAPSATVVDLSHDLRPHDVREAAFVVRAMAEGFPAGSIHVVVVDPGVGGARAPIVVQCRDGSALVGPDNGVLAPLAEALGGGVAYRIERVARGSRPRVGATFDGRDVFAPAAAELAQGRPASRLGRPVGLRRPSSAPPARRRDGASGVVVHVDHFGNLITDLPTEWLPPGTGWVTVKVGRTRHRLPVVRSYEAGGPGRLVVLGSSFGTLELAVGQGRASDALGAGVGTAVLLGWQGPRLPARRNRK